MTPEQQGPELLTVCCKDCQQRQVGTCGDKWNKRIEPTETIELCWPGNLSLRWCETEQYGS